VFTVDWWSIYYTFVSWNKRFWLRPLFLDVMMFSVYTKALIQQATKLCVLFYVFLLFCVFLLLFYVFLLLYVFCVVLCIVRFVSFSLSFVFIFVLYYCHRLATQLQLNISYSQAANQVLEQWHLNPHHCFNYICHTRSFPKILSCFYTTLSFQQHG
jgi:hypothetical protein